MYSAIRLGTTTEILNTLRERLSTIAVDVVAEVGRIDLTMRDVLSLRLGDVIRLSNVRMNDPMALNVGNRRKFMCKPGMAGKKLAVQIVQKLEETDHQEFEELVAEGED